MQPYGATDAHGSEKRKKKYKKTVIIERRCVCVPEAMQEFVPVLPKFTAVIFCIFNILLPGSGTFCGGWAILCCGLRDYSGTKDRCKMMWINICFALLQLILVPVLLLGWIWSIVWGVAMVYASVGLDEITVHYDTGSEEEHGGP